MTSTSVHLVADRMLSDFMGHTLSAEPGIAVVDLGADVLVIDVASCADGWLPALREARIGSPRGRVVLLADHDDVESAVAAARAGVVAWLPPGGVTEDLVSVVRAVAAGAGHYPSRHLGAVLRALWDGLGEGTVDPRLQELTERERDVLGFLTEGLASRDIADRMHVSVNTVRSHTRRLFAKLNVHHRLEAVRVARELGVTPSPW